MLCCEFQAVAFGASWQHYRTTLLDDALRTGTCIIGEFTYSISQSYGNPLLTDLDIILCNTFHLKGWISFLISQFQL